MKHLLAFQTAAHEGGFVEMYETADGTVLWLKKNESNSEKEIDPRLCLDALTHSATVFWMAGPGMHNSKTFRDVPAMQEWFKPSRLS